MFVNGGLALTGVKVILMLISLQLIEFYFLVCYRIASEEYSNAYQLSGKLEKLKKELDEIIQIVKPA